MLGSHVRRLAYLSFAVVAACGPQRRLAPQPERFVVVDNRGFADMNIYVIEGTRRQRIGSASGLTTTRLRLPRSMASGTRTLRFFCDPIGGNRTAVTQDITVGPEETINLTIHPD